MNSKAINLVGSGLAMLVMLWVAYAMMKSTPSTPTVALAQVPPGGAPGSSAMASLGTYQQIISSADPNTVPLPSSPILPAPADAPAEDATPADGSTPATGKSGPGATPPASPPRRSVPAEKWNFDFKQKPLPPDVE